MHVYTGRFKLTGAKSTTYKNVPGYMRISLFCDNAHARYHGALEMDFEISSDKLTPYAIFRAFAVLTKRACA